MMGASSSSSRIAAGLGAALFVAYCIYFDKKRRSDPNYKNKLRERRKKQKAVQEKAGLSKLPDLKDAEAVQKFFLEEIQLGEELLAQGEIPLYHDIDTDPDEDLSVTTNGLSRPSDSVCQCQNN